MLILTCHTIVVLRVHRREGTGRIVPEIMNCGLAIVWRCLGIFAFTGPSIALAGNVVSDARQTWPNRSVAVVVCDTASTAAECGGTRNERLRNSLSKTELRAVHLALATWRRQFSGHIVFKPVKSLSGQGVVIQAPRRPSRCSTRWTGYRQAYLVTRVQIGSHCNARNFDQTTVGTVLHELMHVAGVYHEQQRRDRGKFVVVKGTKQGDRQWSRICETGRCATRDRAAVPSGAYDFASIMHYSLPGPEGKRRVSLTSFGRKRLDRQQLSLSDVGQRERLSAGDVAAIKRLYPRAR